MSVATHRVGKYLAGAQDSSLPCAPARANPSAGTFPNLLESAVPAVDCSIHGMKGAKKEVETVPFNLSADTFHFMGQSLYGGDRWEAGLNLPQPPGVGGPRRGLLNPWYERRKRGG